MGEIIRAAADSKHAVGFAYHNMDLSSPMSRWRSKYSAFAERHTIGLAREVSMVIYRDMLQNAEFVNVFKLVVGVGSDGAPPLASLQSFASKFVSSQVRRLLLNAFPSAAGLPPKCPRLKIAVLKLAHSHDPR